ncbi:MAG: undecaprenyl-diphosphate phosphatase [Thermomicrobiales bacterium]
MSDFQAIVLGLVQGLTEFLPVSSSAHLIIVPWLFGWDEPGLSFDAALHLGTLAAVLVFFWREFWGMALAIPRALEKPKSLLFRREPLVDEKDRSARLLILIAIATVPGLIAGVLAESAVDDLFHTEKHQSLAMAIIALMLMGVGLIMLQAERRATLSRGMDDLELADSAAIGLVQATAIVPGVSRSGATITLGLFRGLKREDAARFSFLLGTPLIAGAGAKGMLDTLQSGLSGHDATAFALGMITSAISGFFAIGFLLRYLQRASIRAFVVYRIAMGALILLLLATGLR